MKKLFYIFLAGFLPLMSFAQNASADQMDVMMKMASLRSALLSKDSVALSGLLADDVTYGHTNGVVQTKVQLISDVMSGVQDYKSIEPSDMKVRVYGSTGIVNMKSKVSMIFQGNNLDLTMAVVFVWIKNDKGWKLVARQSVKQ